jgi:hypothetical protein
MLPVVAPVGTTTAIELALQLVMEVAAMLLKLTVLDPCEEPKFVPVMVTEEPTLPALALKLVMVGGGSVTVKGWPLLAVPPTVTATLPDVAPVGTAATMAVAVQLVIDDAATLLKVRVLEPCEEPKLVPTMTTGLPT